MFAAVSGEAQKRPIPPAMPALIDAIFQNDTATGQKLLAEGAKPDTRYEGRTALMIAACRHLAPG